MASNGALLDSLSCPICLDLLKDPVTTPCGHSYCMKCIHQHWDQQNACCTCPQCRQSFRPRPVLSKNIMLSDLVEQMMKTRLKTQEPERAQKILLHKQAELERLRQEAQEIQSFAETAVQSSRDNFTEMAHLVKRRRSEVEKQIRSEEQTQLKRVQKLQDQLQRDLTELRKTVPELDKLDHSQHFSPPGNSDTARARTGPQLAFENVTTAVSALRDRLEQVLMLDLNHVPPALSPACASQSPPALRTRDDFLQYYTEITLDPNTAHSLLSLSEGNRRVTVRTQSYPDHPDRFTVFRQVLSRQSMTGRCYWEMEWSGKWVRIAVSYIDIQRKGDSDDCLFGSNDKSWALHCDRGSYSFRFNSTRSTVPGPVSSRLGIFLDHSAGVLSFYSISQTMTLLHRVQTTFTGPLLTGVGLGWCNNGDTAHFPQLVQQEVQLC